jgi:hypothetical protein
MQVRTVIVSFLALPMVAFAQSSASLDLLNFAMGDAQIVAGANVTAAKASVFGQFALSQIQSGDASLQKFINETGIDPRSDISEILLASEGSKQWFIAAHGSFGVAIPKLEAAIEQDGGTVTHLPGVDLIRPANMAGLSQGGTCIALFTDGSTALAGDCANVQSAAQSGGTTAAPNTNVFTTARQLRAAQDLWITSVVPLTDFGVGLPSELGGVVQTNLFKAIQQISGGVKFALNQGAAIQVSGQALMDSPKDATSLLNVLTFITGMIQTQAGGEPIASLLGSLEASTNGSTLNVSLAIPESALEQIIESGHKTGEHLHTAGVRARADATN